MNIPTKYGNLHITQHARLRWIQRTGRTEWELIGSALKARRPTKNQLRRIMKKRRNWQPRRILECEHAFFLIQGKSIVTVYDKWK